MPLPGYAPVALDPDPADSGQRKASRALSDAQALFQQKAQNKLKLGKGR